MDFVAEVTGIQYHQVSALQAMSTQTISPKLSDICINPYKRLGITGLFIEFID
jgi:hypothetical protein